MGNLPGREYTDYRYINQNINEEEETYSPIQLETTYEIESEAYKNQKLNEDSTNFDKENLIKVEIPTKKIKIFRPIRSSRNSFSLIKPHSVNYIEELKVFYFSSLFTEIEIDIEDSFIVQFVNHCVILHDDLISILTKNLPDHLLKVHGANKEKFTFTKLRNILAKDFTNCDKKLKCYNSYFVRNLTKDNFDKIITQIVIEEGEVFTMVNQILRNKDINDNILFYLICLLYVYGNYANHSELPAVYKTIDNVDLDLFKPKNSLMNFELISTTKDANTTLYMKNIIEITFERIVNKNWYLSYKGIDTSLFSQYPSEKEILIQPYAIFEVTSIEKTENGYYIKLFMKSNCLNESSSMKMQPQMQLNLGVCDDVGSNILEMYPNIDLSRVASLTIKNKDSLIKNLINIGCMKNLRVLDMKNIEMNDEDLITVIPYISNFTFLNYLNLSQNDIGINGMSALMEIFPFCTYLEYINMNQNNLGDQGTIDLANGILALKNLRSLCLVYNQIKYKGVEGISYAIAECPNLKMLNLSTNFVYHEEMDTLIWALGKLPNLVYLNLSNNQISSEGLAMIGDILPPTIQRLNFSENEITQEGIQDFAGNLYRCPNLLALILYGNKNGTSGIYGLCEAFHNIPELEELNLGCNCIGDPELMLLSNFFYKLPRLKILNLRENSITNDGLTNIISKLQDLKSLNTLDLGWNPIDDKHLDEGCLDRIADCLSQIKPFYSLNLEDNQIPTPILKSLMHNLRKFDSNWNYTKGGEFTRRKKEDKEEFASTYIMQKKTMTKEILRFNNVDPSHLTEELSHLEKYDHVKHLIFARDKLEMSSLKLIAENLKNFSQLCEIDMRCNEIGNEGLIELSKGLKYTPKVHTFILRENNIGDEGMIIFAQNLVHLTELKSLNLNWNSISDEGMKALSQVNFEKLETLKLKENNIKKDGMIEFSKNLKNFKSLCHLDLGWNSIGGEGMKAFSENMSVLTELNFLLLSKNEIGDSGIKEFASRMKKLPKLQTLLLWNNKIGDEGGEIIFKEMKNCKNLKILDMSINEISDELKQKFITLRDEIKISIDI